MKLVLHVFVWILEHASLATSVLRVTPHNASNNDTTPHPNLHSDAIAAGSVANTSIGEVSQQKLSDELDQLRETRFFSREGAARGPVKTVWIVGMGRSGTTLLQNLVVAAAVGEDVSVFAAFEPCHSRDLWKGTPVGEKMWTAAKCMERAIRCDFSEIKQYHKKWTRLEEGQTRLPLPRADVSEACAKSTVRVFKTILPVPTSFWHISTWIDVPPEVRIIQISRDPRSIFSSVISNFDAMKSQYTPMKICRTELQWVPEWGNVTLKGHLHPIKFESFVTRHSWEVQRLLKYLSWHDSAALSYFINTHMSAIDCTEHNRKYGYTYGTCRTKEETWDVIMKWKRKLYPDQKTKFTYVPCQRAVSKFGYLGTFWGSLYT